MLAPLLLRQRWFVERAMSVAPSNLILCIPGGDASGTLARGLANPVEFLTNGNFETAGAGGADVFGTWAETAGDGAIADEGTLVHGGSHAAKLTAGATANTKLAQTIAVRPESIHTLYMWTRGDGTYGGRYLVYDVTNAANIIAATATGITGTTYTLVTVSFTTPAACVSVRLDLMCPSTDTGIAYFDDVSVMGVLTGTYTGVTLGQAGIGDGRTSWLDDGTAGYCNLYTSGLVKAFSGAEGTIIAPAKVSAAGVWTDGTERYIYRFRVDGNNQLYIARTVANNTLNFGYLAGGVGDSVTWLSGALTRWMWLGFTWTKSGERVTAYESGAIVGTSATLGVWAGSLSTSNAVIGATNITPSNVWSGYIGPLLLWNTALSPAQMAWLRRV